MKNLTRYLPSSSGHSQLRPLHTGPKPTGQSWPRSAVEVDDPLLRGFGGPAQERTPTVEETEDGHFRKTFLRHTGQAKAFPNRFFFFFSDGVLQEEVDASHASEKKLKAR